MWGWHGDRGGHKLKAALRKNHRRLPDAWEEREDITEGKGASRTVSSRGNVFARERGLILTSF